MLGLSARHADPTLLSVVEKAGVLVLAILLISRTETRSLCGPESIRRVDQSSSFRLGRPGDRVRYSIAHELGHLVLHPTIKGQISDAEKEADQFAAEFLMPEIAMRRELAPPITLPSVSRLKARWRVAIQALVRRAFELAIITKRQYTYLFEQIGARGWRTSEPVEVPIEKPRAFKKMAEVIYGLRSTTSGSRSTSRSRRGSSRTSLLAHADKSEFGDNRGVGRPASSGVPRFPRRVLPLRRL